MLPGDWWQYLEILLVVSAGESAFVSSDFSRF